MLSLILSIERDEIHGNRTNVVKLTLNLLKAYRYDQTNVRTSWIFDLIFWKTAIGDTRNVS